MTIFSLYIFDRHCECVYYQDWHRTRLPRAETSPKFKPNVHRIAASLTQNETAKESIFDQEQKRVPESRVVSGVSTVGRGERGERGKSQGAGGGSGGGAGTLPFDEEAKLVYGVILSLRNMVKKLSGRDEAFTSYSTSLYKLHLYETLTGYKFVLLSDPSSDSLRFVLRQLYIGPFVEYVVRNPLVELDSRERGVDNDQFRAAVDKNMRGLSMFQ